MPKSPVVVYGLPHCSTCQKAVDKLEEAGLKIAEFRDLKTNPLSKAEVKKLAKAVGGPTELFSKRAMKYRAMGLHERELGDEEMLDLMTQEYTFIKRPTMVCGDVAVCGGSAKSMTAIIEAD